MGNAVIIPVDAHLLTLTISRFKVVERPVHVGRETRIQHERIQSKDEIPTQRSAAIQSSTPRLSGAPSRCRKPSMPNR